MNGMRPLDDLRRDVRHGVRLLSQSPMFALVSVVALAVGIGANLTIFGFVNALLVRPLPAAEPERLIRADLGGASITETAVPFDDYLAYRDRNRSLSQLALFYPAGISPVRIGSRPAEAIQFTPVTGNYFETLGIRAALGRLLTPSDDRRDSGAVVLSDEGWRRHFAADPDVVGQTIFIEGIPFAVVGVTGPAFTGTVPPVLPRMYATWNAIRLPPSQTPRGFMIGRLRPDASVATAQADFARIATQLRAERKTQVSIAVYAAKTSMPAVQRILSVFAALFMVIVGAVLWAACSNVAILQLVRSTARRKEIAIRLALGASRFQVTRQLLAETLVLAVLAGLAGTALAAVTARWLTRMPLPVPVPIGLTFEFDWRVSAFAIALSLVATMMSGLTAALDARHTNPADALRDGTGARPVARRSLIATQVALTTALLLVGHALTRSLATPPDRGLDATGVVLATVPLPRTGYTADRIAPFFERLLTEAESAPGVTSAALVETIPVAINRPLLSVDVKPDRPFASGDGGVTSPRALVNHVSRGHFRTLGIPLVQGRDFTAQDDAGAPRVVIVNQTAARRFWPGQVVVGKLIRLGEESATVIGLAKDSKYESLVEEAKPMVYRPIAQAQMPSFEATLLVKTVEPRKAFDLVRSLVSNLDPDLAVTNLNTLEDRLNLALLPNRAAAIAAGLLGVAALGLGAIGTYSVMAFLVLQRRREIGIRVALGAVPHAVVAMITRQGLRSAVIGVAVGTGAGLGILSLLRGVVVGVPGNDVATLFGVPVLLMLVSYFACSIPARYATRGNPLAVLRE